MTIITRSHHVAGAIVLALAVSSAVAQGVPRDEYPLPPASEIRPIEPAGVGPQPGERADEEGAAAGVGGLEDLQRARDALDELLRAYEAGNVAKFQQKLDPAMVGYQVFLDGVRRDVAAYRNLRIHLTDTQITAGPDLAVIQIAWEKRFLSAGSFTPGIFTGRSTVLMHRDGDAWQLSAVALDNPFSSASGVLARFTVMPMALGVTTLDGDVPMQVEVVDADMAGAETVQVTVSSANGDRETLQLPSVSPGVFRIISVPLLFEPGTPVPNNLLVEVPGPGTVTFRYVDANPGDNRPASTLTRVVRVQ
ncbi:MAG: hypothetical protein IT486_07595 [Gammaproteobacteria bacterium]|nr:hypothetical protein [Gammaproteobacteria bacterium]